MTEPRFMFVVRLRSIRYKVSRHDRCAALTIETSLSLASHIVGK